MVLCWVKVGHVDLAGLLLVYLNRIFKEEKNVYLEKNQKLTEKLLVSHREPYWAHFFHLVYMNDSKNKSPQQASNMLLYADETAIKTTSSVIF